MAHVKNKSLLGRQAREVGINLLAAQDGHGGDLGG